MSIDQARREYKATTDARANRGMSWNKVSGRQAGAADSAPKEVGRGGYLRASVGPLRADDMPDELARCARGPAPWQSAWSA
jgi:hypothetical protein